MRTLFTDLASHEGLLACVDASRVVAHAPVDHRMRDHELLPMVTSLLGRAGWMWEDLERVACVVGPGGFMSLRVAVSFANAVAWDRGMPIAPVHLSDLAAARVTERDWLWIHSTKKQEVFVHGFGAHKTLWPEPAHLSLEEFLTKLPSGVRWAGELLSEHQLLVEARGATPADLRPLEEVLPAFLATLPYSKQLLEPWYGRGW